MNSSPSQWEAQMQSLTEANETLLRSKSKLQQDLLTLKKELVQKDQQLQAQTTLGLQQAEQITGNEQVINELRIANRDQQEQLLNLKEELSRLEQENRRLQQRSWLQKLFGKK